MKRLAAFVFAGSAGFVADAGCLAALLCITSLGPFLARLMSIAFAMTLTWTINRSVTWGPSDRTIAEEGARYAGVGLMTSLCNYLIYSGLLLSIPAMLPLPALVLATIPTTVLSYIGYSRLVFDRRARS